MRINGPRAWWLTRERTLNDAVGIFGRDAVAAERQARIRELHEKIAELTVEPFFLQRWQSSPA